MSDPAFTLDTIKTPIGTALIASDDQGHLRILDWEEHEARMRRLAVRQYKAGLHLTPGHAPAALRKQLMAYFCGDLRSIDALPCAFEGTAFQQRIWQALRAIPAGKTLTYGALAKRLKLSPASARAVGLANGANPISVVIPCHRLIGADGSLSGYGGGLHRKEWLLRHEGVAIA
ncbi:methylated-DNA--[protein]-cysteine S-methyltransferase [Ferrovibrio sp. MS7]|uniref:methylated-DNA--[protein]-cysteine S-methyltransferase n=1 Tax=Ferrovibrio plantarum TaxID=3119164 RepID=UPI001B4F3C67|nr:methylated-DNA--[protein]-cysteine S-methyltransferase [Ferrovibrio sp.]